MVQLVLWGTSFPKKGDHLSSITRFKERSFSTFSFLSNFPFPKTFHCIRSLYLPLPLSPFYKLDVGGETSRRRLSCRVLSSRRKKRLEVNKRIGVRLKLGKENNSVFLGHPWFLLNLQKNERSHFQRTLFLYLDSTNGGARSTNFSQTVYSPRINNLLYLRRWVLRQTW